jgi:endonuclease III
MGRFARAPQTSKRLVAEWRSQQTAARELRGTQRSSANNQVTLTQRALRSLNAELHRLYGTPHLGNLSDPTGEFVYIMLARKTPERAYQSAFRAIKASGNWEHVAGLSQPELSSVIRGCGLETKKARAILKGLSRINARFGAFDLRRAAPLSDTALLEFLSSLPEVGPKSALCIMLYAFRRPVFPVDAHVGRVLARLGILDSSVPGLRAMDHKRRQRALACAVPPDLRYGLHVNLLVHGRTICRALNPRCADCSLLGRCIYGQERSASARCC